MIISTTVEQHGYGRAKYKWVSGATPKERQAAREGKPVYFKPRGLSGGNHGTYWRVMIYRNGRYYPRVPERETVEALESMARVGNQEGEG